MSNKGKQSGGQCKGTMTAVGTRRAAPKNSSEHSKSSKSQLVIHETQTKHEQVIHKATRSHVQVTLETPGSHVRVIVETEDSHKRVTHGTSTHQKQVIQSDKVRRVTNGGGGGSKSKSSPVGVSKSGSVGSKKSLK